MWIPKILGSKSLLVPKNFKPKKEFGYEYFFGVKKKSFDIFWGANKNDAKKREIQQILGTKIFIAQLWLKDQVKKKLIQKDISSQRYQRSKKFG